MENILVGENLATIEDVEKLRDKAVEENYEFYVGISKSGDRFGVVDGQVKRLGADEYARNDLYVAKNELDEVKEEEKEPVEEEVVAEEEPLVEEKVEEVHEVSEEEAEANAIKLAAYDILEAKCKELEDLNAALNNEIAKLNGQVDELTLKLNSIECQVVPEHETDLEDVCKFLKENHIVSLTVSEKE